MDTKQKILHAVRDMSSKISRDAKHIYHDPITGTAYQGVSTVSSIIPKDWLAAWGAKEAVKFLGYSDYEDYSVANEMLLKIRECKTPKAYVDILREAKGAQGRKSKQAMIDGKAGHLWIETYIQAKIDHKPLPKIPSGTLERPIGQWLTWEKESIKEWISSESLVVRPDKLYAGQLDATALMTNGMTAMIDFKFASNVSEDYYLQTAGYCAAFEPYGVLFDDRIIVRLPKTLEKEEWNEDTHKYKKIPNDIEVHVVPTRYEADRDAFFHALPLKGWINYVTKLSENKKKEIKTQAKAKELMPFNEYPKEKIDPKDIPF